MFHHHLDQTSKRYKSHPNVAATYTSLPNDNNAATRPAVPPPAEQQENPIKTRDFAYPPSDDPELSTTAFLANFYRTGFRRGDDHRHICKGDLLCKKKAGDRKRKAMLLQEEEALLSSAAAGGGEIKKKAPFFPGFQHRGGGYQWGWGQRRRQKGDEAEAEEEKTAVKRVSSDRSGAGTTAADDVPSSVATGATTKESAEKGGKEKRSRRLQKNQMMIAVAVCMLDHMK